jgi:hypothetical protein
MISADFTQADVYLQGQYATPDKQIEYKRNARSIERSASKSNNSDL